MNFKLDSAPEIGQIVESAKGVKYEVTSLVMSNDMSHVYGAMAIKADGTAKRGVFFKVVI